MNAAPTAVKQAAEEDAYKVLILDRWTKDLVAPLLRVNDLRRHGVTLHLLLEAERQPIPDVPAIYLVRATEENVKQLISDVAQGLYDSAHLNFVGWAPQSLLEMLASGEAYGKPFGEGGVGTGMTPRGDGFGGRGLLTKPDFAGQWGQSEDASVR